MTISINTVTTGDTAGSWPTNTHYHCYANGRYWVFSAAAYFRVLYSSSTDGITWSAPDSIGTIFVNDLRGTGGSYGPYTTPVNMVLDGAYLHCLGKFTHLGPNGYNRYTLNSDGSITGGTFDRAIPLGSIRVDGSGYPYILYPTGTQWVVVKSSTNDGTFTPESPVAIYTGTSTTGLSKFVQLSGNKYAAVVYDFNNGLGCAIFDGASWGSMAFFTLPGTDATWDACALNDTVQVYYSRTPTISGVWSRNFNGTSFNTAVQLSGNNRKFTSESLGYAAILLMAQTSLTEVDYCTTMDGSTYSSFVPLISGYGTNISSIASFSSGTEVFVPTINSSSVVEFASGIVPSIYPTDPLLRVTGITRTFWAGKKGQMGVYQAELNIGGMGTGYIPPVASKEFQPTVPLPNDPITKQQYSPLYPQDYQAWINSFGNLSALIQQFGHMPTYDEWWSLVGSKQKGNSRWPGFGPNIGGMK